ncbi:MAG: hypothetical protein HKN33_09300 [Pyrinomonadaceae bacterium]|nr:hypothetical protein [Pyrinomonadaceae bacterium]
MKKELQQYEVVVLTAVSKHVRPWAGKDQPQEGDKAVVLEVLQSPKLMYELECSDENGATKWIVKMEQKDFRFRRFFGSNSENDPAESK